MNRDKGKIIGIAGAVAVHLTAFLFLFFYYIHRPEEQVEGGVPVMLGNSELSQGMFDPATMTEVEIAPQDVSATEETEQPVITQTQEPSISIPPKKKEAVKKPKKEETPKKEVKSKEKTEAEKRAAQQASKQIAGAFGKGAKLGDSGSGTEGSPTGNSTEGKKTGTGGYGTFDLNGRSIGGGGLPRPVYNVQDEGRVVVTITVNPAGTVISTSINKRTNTVNAALRRAAEDAARRARFNSIESVNNQTGTITYYFKLK